eukprot:tig00021537_g22303.t1
MGFWKKFKKIGKGFKSVGKGFKKIGSGVKKFAKSGGFGKILKFATKIPIVGDVVKSGQTFVKAAIKGDIKVRRR